MVYLNQI